MILLPRRCILAIAAVVDIAVHARPTPIAAKALAERHDLPPRHLETLLQSLVRNNILKGVRGPKGGYELARERRKITVGEIVRTALADTPDDESADVKSTLVSAVVAPLIEQASRELLGILDSTTIEQLCHSAQAAKVFGAKPATADFEI
ncbi:MAG: Rrf2 family transcriptional regulator [Alphaproteobacteria bacterium]|nr:Rrf2 family transcriptional regulator [Alphaproteobacteria bacterium]